MKCKKIIALVLSVLLSNIFMPLSIFAEKNINTESDGAEISLTSYSGYPYSIIDYEVGDGIITIIAEKYQNILGAEMILAEYSDAGALINIGKKEIPSSGDVGFELEFNYTGAKFKVFVWQMDNIIPIADVGSWTMYSRGEWIYQLMTKIDAEIIDSDGITNYYADTQGTPYEDAIESAKSYGIIMADEDEQDVPEFKPDQVADREFAAVTSALAMGYVGNEEGYICEDVSDITYPELVNVAIDENMMALYNGYFYPHRALSPDDKNSIFRSIDRITYSSIITEEKEEITYASGVVSTDISDYEILTANNGTYGILIKDNEQSINITVDKCFVLPPNDEFPSGIALKATNVYQAGGYTLVEATVPEDLSEVMSSMVFAGQAEPAVNNVEVLDENISCTYDSEGTIGDSGDIELSAIGGSFSVPGKWTFDFGDGVKIGEHSKIKGKAEVTIPDITAYMDIDFGWFSVDVNEVTVSITEKAKISTELEYVVAESEIVEGQSGAKEFARVPFALGSTGLSIDLVFSLYYDIHGSISIIYTVEATQGIQYKNNNFRFIHNFTNQLEIPKIEGSGEIGLQPAINLVFFGIWDIVGISGRIGASGTASLIYHADANLTCIDGTIYLSAKVGLNEETIVGSFLKEYKHYTLEKEIFNKDNSPLKLGIHFENLHKVPECTYGKGKITGYVYDANTHDPIQYARVTVYKGDDVKAIKYTNREGMYNVDDGLPVGNVTIEISATGYQTYKDTREINRNVVTYIESYMMVGKDETGSGNVSGAFINALTGDSVSDVKYEVRKGWNNISGDYLISSEASERYNFDIPAGNYTVYATADSFIPTSVNIAVNEGSSCQADIILAPENSDFIDASGTLRFVLTWAEYPEDIDSHLFGPTTDGTGVFHTYFSDKEYYSGDLIANLDLDDVDSYGPETTTIYKMNDSGMYSFYVHDYTNRDSQASTQLSKSSARVTIYNGKMLYATFNVPTNVEGTLWHVFDYDASTGVITPVNTMSYGSDPSNLNLSGVPIAGISENEAKQIISSAVK